MAADMRTILIAALALLCVGAAHADWKPQYASASANIQAWYKDAVLTPAAQKRLHFIGCCDGADVVKTKFKLDTSKGNPHWFYLKDGQWAQIPDDIIHWDEQAPDNQPTLFHLSFDFNGNPAGTLTCFYPPGGGL